MQVFIDSGRGSPGLTELDWIGLGFTGFYWWVGGFYWAWPDFDD